MKNVMIGTLIVWSFSFAEVDTPIDCATDDESIRDLTIDNIRGGAYVPSIGDLKVLVVFAKLVDDNDDYGYWPENADYVSELATFLSNIVNESVSDPPTSGNLTEYFDENSLTQFNLYGDIYPDIVTMNYLIGFTDVRTFTKDLLDEIDPYVDFQDYDNWTKSTGEW